MLLRGGHALAIFAVAQAALCTVHQAGLRVRALTCLNAYGGTGDGSRRRSRTRRSHRNPTPRGTVRRRLSPRAFAASHDGTNQKGEKETVHDEFAGRRAEARNTTSPFMSRLTRRATPTMARR